MRDEVLRISIEELEVGDQGQFIMPEDWCFDSFISDGDIITGVVVTRFAGAFNLPDEDSPF